MPSVSWGYAATLGGLCSTRTMTDFRSTSQLAEDATRTIKNALRGARQCALVDFPDHGNVGDSAIWSGEIEILKSLGVTIAYVSNLHSLSAGVLNNVLDADDPVLIHGGGNFGSVWPAHQEHRHRILRECRGRPVIQLPQSVHYAKPADAMETRDLIKMHGQFTMMVRDEPSKEFVIAQLAVDATLCTDSALALHSRLMRRKPQVDILVLARTDKERRDDGAATLAFPADVHVQFADWVDDPSTLGSVAAGTIWPRASGRLTSLPGFFRVLRCAWDAAANARVTRGCNLLSRGRVVVTDRLHAHILCTMLGIPHVVMDNSYRKVGNFIDAWTAGNPLVHRATDAEHAAALAVQLLSA